MDDALHDIKTTVSTSVLFVVVVVGLFSFVFGLVRVFSKREAWAVSYFCFVVAVVFKKISDFQTIP